MGIVRGNSAYSVHGGEDGEHTGISFVEISKTFVIQNAFGFGMI